MAIGEMGKQKKICELKRDRDIPIFCMLFLDGNGMAQYLCIRPAFLKKLPSTLDFLCVFFFLLGDEHGSESGGEGISISPSMTGRLNECQMEWLGQVLGS